MEEFMTSSISVSVNKGSADEEMSLFRASMEDAASRLAEGVKPETISNEKIQKGDEILGTYLSPRMPYTAAWAVCGACTTTAGTWIWP